MWEVCCHEAGLLSGVGGPEGGADGVSVDCGVVVQSLAGMVQYALTSPLSFFLAVDELIKEHAGFRDHFLQQ